MWPELIQAAKEGGLNTIESYVFWSGHELSPGKVRGVFFFFLVIYLSILLTFFSSYVGIYFKYSFEGRYDLVKFVKTVQQAGMYMILRIGPFVAAEYNYGYAIYLMLPYID